MNLQQRILRRTVGYMPFLVCFIILSLSETFQTFSLINATVQLLLFVAVVCIPAYLTKRMSYVDIGWPWGLVMIGLLTLLLGDGYWLRTYIIGTMYLFAGLRMGLGAITLWRKGHLNKELPRYQYQRRRWEKGGYTNQDFSLQYEIMIQAFANITFLAVPAMLQAFNPSPSLSFLEICGYILWVLSFGMEHLADLQKQRFLKKARAEHNRKACCNVGLWKYSRHPNYFAEWMVWNALILSSGSSLIYFFDVEKIYVWLGLLVGLLYISRIMYVTLVYYTGAVPSEYYSLQKRPGYAKYQETTSMFFPAKPK